MKTTVLLVSLVLSAILCWTTIAATQVPPGSEPVTVTRQMLADLLCFSATDRYVECSYEAARDTLVISQAERRPITADSTRIIRDGKPVAPSAQERAQLEQRAAQMEATSRSNLRNLADARLTRLLPLIQKYVSPNPKTEFHGFE
jgi:hypothetical protein